jgi:hypothetical protein
LAAQSPDQTNDPPVRPWARRGVFYVPLQGENGGANAGLEDWPSMAALRQAWNGTDMDPGRELSMLHGFIVPDIPERV